MKFANSAEFDSWTNQILKQSRSAIDFFEKAQFLLVGIFRIANSVLAVNLETAKSIKEDVMLVLSRKTGETICIGQDIRLTVSAVSGSRVKICIDAPRECAIRRQEIYCDHAENYSAQSATATVAR